MNWNFPVNDYIKSVRQERVVNTKAFRLLGHSYSVFSWRNYRGAPFRFLLVQFLLPQSFSLFSFLQDLIFFCHWNFIFYKIITISPLFLCYSFFWNIINFLSYLPRQTKEISCANFELVPFFVLCNKWFPFKMLRSCWVFHCY